MTPLELTPVVTVQAVSWKIHRMGLIGHKALSGVARIDQESKVHIVVSPMTFCKSLVLRDEQVRRKIPKL